MVTWKPSSPEVKEHRRQKQLIYKKKWRAKRRAEKLSKSTILSLKCKYCRKPMDRQIIGFGLHHTYCSQVCRCRAWKKSYQEKYGITWGSANYHATKKKVSRGLFCKHCKRPFIVHHNLAKIHCCVECRTAADKQRRRGRHTKKVTS